MASDRPQPTPPAGDPTGDPAGDDVPTPDNRVRVGHDERQRAADSLAEHFAAGRLEQSEFEERTGAAWQAKTVADLTPLFFDLPGGSLDGYLTSQATSGAERSARAPAVAPTAGNEVDAAAGTEKRGTFDKVLNILMGTFPILMVLLFFLLRGVGVDMAWLVFLAIPIFYITVANLRGDDEDEEDEDVSGDDVGGAGSR